MSLKMRWFLTFFHFFAVLVFCEIYLDKIRQFSENCSIFINILRGNSKTGIQMNGDVCFGDK